MTFIQSVRRTLHLGGRDGRRATGGRPPPGRDDRPAGAGDRHRPDRPALRLSPGRTGSGRHHTLELDSPALRELRAAGVALVVPLVTQGELIGTLNLGPRLSEQDYSSDDRRLLATLAAQAAPAIRVAQLVREQAAEAAERERYAQELQRRPADPAAVPAAPAAEPARVAGRRLLRARPRRRRRLLRLHRARRRTDRHRRRRRHRQGRARPRWSWPGPTRSCAPRRRASCRRRRSWRAQRAARRRDAREHVRDLPVPRPRARRPATSSTRTPATTCPTFERPTASSSSGRRGCRSA